MLANSFRTFAGIAFLTISACSTVPPGEFNDPFEASNRRMHAFNKSVDSKLIRPLASPLESGGDEPNGALILLGNVGGNLSLPGKVANHLLQGRPGRAATNASRFIVNTTLGLGGIMDPAGNEFGLDEIDTDFGETLYVWGAPEGAYLELPILGPSTQRDAAGKVVDWVFNPTDLMWGENEAKVASGIRLLSKAGDRARFGDSVDSILYESADSYAQARLLYLQHRGFELGKEGGEIDPYDE